MAKSTRRVAIELHENVEAIECMAGHATGAPAEAARSPAIGHKTLASLYSARQRQEPHKTYDATLSSMGSFLRLCMGIAGGSSRGPLWQLHGGRSYNSRQLDDRFHESCQLS